ncbi:MAG: hypothetical protein ACMUIM_01840 [bacterium]
MIVRNLYLRLLFGLYSIFLGLLLLKLHHDKNRDNRWGILFRALSVMRPRNRTESDFSWVYILLGWMSIIGGLIAIFYGFRLTMVG